MRAVDDDTEVKVQVVRMLMLWGSLPESDVSRMLRQYFLVTDDFRDMAEEGLIDMDFRGDEFVLSVTTLGRIFLEQEGERFPASRPPSQPR